MPILNPQRPKSFAIPRTTWIFGNEFAYEAAVFVLFFRQVFKYNSSKIKWKFYLPFDQLHISSTSVGESIEPKGLLGLHIIYPLYPSI